MPLVFMPILIPLAGIATEGSLDNAYATLPPGLICTLFLAQGLNVCVRQARIKAGLTYTHQMVSGTNIVPNIRYFALMGLATTLMMASFVCFQSNLYFLLASLTGASLVLGVLAFCLTGDWRPWIFTEDPQRRKTSAK
jgi:hypothetical protein